MLFSYKYIDNNVELMQKFMKYIVLDLWCKANGDFSLDKIENNELKQIIINIQNNPRITKDYLYGPIEEIFNIFRNFNTLQKRTVADWFIMNNEIENLCDNTLNIYAITFKDLDLLDINLSQKINKFFTSIYTDVINLTDVKKVIGEGLMSHYKKFTTVNNEGICPFCGIHDLKGIDHKPREAYDHYLPKGTYPFIAINFKNLAPMCYECNSSYKLKRVPIVSAGIQRKAFYPYSKKQFDIKINMTLFSKNIDNLQPSDMELNIFSIKFREQVNTWKDVFRIDERYKAKIASKKSAKAWLAEVHTAMYHTLTPNNREEYIELLEINALGSPYTKDYLWEVPFIKECKRKGII